MSLFREPSYRAFVRPHPVMRGGGTQTDITRELAILYDLIIDSMDWGSGFLEQEDRETVGKIGLLCGFELPVCERRYNDGFRSCRRLMFHDGDCGLPEILKPKEPG